MFLRLDHNDRTEFVGIENVFSHFVLLKTGDIKNCSKYIFDLILNRFKPTNFKTIEVTTGYDIGEEFIRRIFIHAIQKICILKNKDIGWIEMHDRQIDFTTEKLKPIIKDLRRSMLLLEEAFEKEKV